MGTKVKRSLFKTFLNTGTLVTPVWSLINTGVTSATVGYSPKTTEETYVHEDSATFTVDSYAPNMPIEASITNTEAAFEYLDAKRKARAVLGDAETEVVNVWLYKENANGLYLAEKQSVSVQIDNFGGDGGMAVKMNYTLNYIGVPVVGTFDSVALEFAGTASTALLSNLVITGVTLSPQFKEGRIWYTGTTAAATNVITVTAKDLTTPTTCAIDLNSGTSVISGAAATWDAGDNIVIVTCTNGVNTALYYVFVTKTA
jgi:hypothetical protein